jgi:hypothetical protein
VASTLNTAGVYLMGCGAAWVLHRRGTQLHGTPLNVPALPLVASLGMASMVLLIAAAQYSEIFGLFAVVAGSAALYGVMRFAVPAT